MTRQGYGEKYRHGKEEYRGVDAVEEDICRQID